jgi:lipopolysaccharide export system protein LptC
MSLHPVPSGSARVLGEPSRLLSTRLPRGRLLPTARGIARRRRFVVLAKFSLPISALALLSTIALWPELERASDQGRIAFRRLTGELSGARLTNARYRGIDERGRPYTVTAEIADQIDADRVNLTVPKADVTMTDGTWLFAHSRQGVYLQHAGQLDLWDQVELYRDDGTVLRTPSASIDTKAGAAGGHEPVSAEGPFGTLDAAGFTLTDRGDVIQFHGPARLHLNGQQNGPQK